MIAKGQKINDRYQIIQSIGEGGMANVYLAYDTILDRNVAVKVLRGDLSDNEKFIRRFQREALSSSSLSHPNIVEMYDVGEDDGKYYIVMEYVEGKTLKQLLKKRGKLTVPEVIDIMLQLTDGLAHAHEAYIIHRDIKPQNIMILENGLVKITDFGIAMALNESQLTQTNSIMGSVHYLPPEQANGKGSTIKSDIYSLGILMYELLTGKVPFQGESAVEIALKHMKDEVPSVRTQDPNIPQSVENVIIKSTGKNPKNRYESVKVMHEDLMTVLNPERINEPRTIYQYPEHDLEEPKVSNLKEKEQSFVTKVEDKKDKKDKKKLIILSAIAGVLALGLIFVFFIYPMITEPKDVKVPDVKGKSVEAAEEKLEKVGLKVESKTKKQASDDVDKGKVVKTDPKAGKTVKEGTTVTIYESSGAKSIEVENYVGKNVNTVQTQLEKLGLVVSIEKKNVTDSKIDSNTILAQSPAEGKLEKGDTITLYVPNVVATYPDMVNEGWILSDAEAFAKKYDVNLVKTYQETDKVDEGRILSQSRTAGTEIVAGSTLKIVVAKTPTQTNNNNNNNNNNNSNNNNNTNNNSTTGTDPNKTTGSTE